jgi:hypothetical protein
MQNLFSILNTVTGSKYCRAPFPRAELGDSRPRLPLFTFDATSTERKPQCQGSTYPVLKLSNMDYFPAGVLFVLHVSLKRARSLERRLNQGSPADNFFLRKLHKIHVKAFGIQATKNPSAKVLLFLHAHC